MAGESVSLKKQGECVLQKVRSACARRGANGIRGMQRAFRIMDDNGDLSLSPEEFVTGLMDYGVVLSKQEQKQLTSLFDANMDGRIQINEFFVKMRGALLNGRRLDIVRRAFQKLDRDGSGKVDVNDLTAVYDASQHPQVESGEMNEQQAAVFLRSFDSQTNPDGVVTPAEFEAYYAGVSASIDNDEYFELMMTRVWKLDEPLPPRPQPYGSPTGDAPSPPSPTVRASAAASKGLSRTLTSLEGIAEKAQQPVPPRRIVGYTGHVPGAQETFGESFSKVAERSEVAAAATQKKPPLPPPPFKDDARAFVRKGNAANQHSFRLE